jgi:hypothetical protein
MLFQAFGSVDEALCGCCGHPMYINEIQLPIYAKKKFFFWGGGL